MRTVAERFEEYFVRCHHRKLTELERNTIKQAFVCGNFSGVVEVTKRVEHTDEQKAELKPLIQESIDACLDRAEWLQEYAKQVKLAPKKN